MFRLLLSLALVTCVAPAAALVEARLLALAGQASEVDVYMPAQAPRALAVIAHGFTRSRGRHVLLAERLAQAGFVVAVPDLPHWVQHEANADAIVALVATIVASTRSIRCPWC